MCCNCVKCTEVFLYIELYMYMFQINMDRQNMLNVYFKAVTKKANIQAEERSDMSCGAHIRYHVTIQRKWKRCLNLNP